MKSYCIIKFFMLSVVCLFEISFSVYCGMTDHSLISWISALLWLYVYLRIISDSIIERRNIESRKEYMKKYR